VYTLLLIKKSTQTINCNDQNIYQDIALCSATGVRGLGRHLAASHSMTNVVRINYLKVRNRGVSGAGGEEREGRGFEKERQGKKKQENKTAN
jgi:hypothetical protein